MFVAFYSLVYFNNSLAIADFGVVIDILIAMAMTVCDFRIYMLAIWYVRGLVYTLLLISNCVICGWILFAM